MSENENKTNETINKIKKFLNDNKNEFCYRNLGLLSAHVGVPKPELLKILVNCCEFKIVFNEENYDPNSGPLFALSNMIQKKGKESQAKLRKELEKEREKKKEKPKNKIKNKPKKPLKYVNKKRVKEATKLLIKCHGSLNMVLKKYSLSLFRNDKECMSKLTELMNNFTEIISKISEKNKFSEQELKEK